MTENNQDARARAYATLSSLRKNIDQITLVHGVSETYVHEFQTVLDKLTGIGLDVSEFRIADSEVKRKITGRQTFVGGGSHENHVSYTNEKYVDKPLILTKLDAILGYFELTMSEKPRSIGFRTPD